MSVPGNHHSSTTKRGGAGRAVRKPKELIAPEFEGPVIGVGTLSQGRNIHERRVVEAAERADVIEMEV